MAILLIRLPIHPCVGSFFPLRLLYHSISQGRGLCVVSMFLPSPLFHVTSQTLMAMQVPRLRNFLAGRRRRRGKLSIFDEARLRFPFVVVKGTSVLKTGFVQQGEEVKIKMKKFQSRETPWQRSIAVPVDRNGQNELLF